MPEVADIFRRYGSDYLQQFGDRLLPSHRRACRDILACRTALMGGHLFQCDKCAHELYSYHSCCNRSCPKCHNNTQNWLDERRGELLPVPYFHVTFTLPHHFHDIAHAHQKTVYGILMKAAADSLIQLAADPHYVGATVGVMAVLHTWGRTLSYHLHVHCLVTAGGLSADRTTWLPARKNFLVPVKALSKIFRAIFLERLGQQLPHITIPYTARRSKWVVYSQPALAGTDKVLEYLGRYLQRIAITNRRILSLDDARITFRYKDTHDSQWKTMTLQAQEFIRRFLQHVLPKGFHKVRYFGLWAPSNRHLLHRLQISLPPQPLTPDDSPPIHRHTENDPPTNEPQQRPCPVCERGVLIRIASVPPAGRSPP